MYKTKVKNNSQNVTKKFIINKICKNIKKSNKEL